MPEDPAVPMVPLPIGAPKPVPAAAEPSSKAPAWIPTIFLHVFYPDSRKCGVGWWIFIIATYGLFVAHDSKGEPRVGAQMWIGCVAFAAGLIGGGTIADDKHDLEMAKISAVQGAPNVSDA